MGTGGCGSDQHRDHTGVGYLHPNSPHIPVSPLQGGTPPRSLTLRVKSTGLVHQAFPWSNHLGYLGAGCCTRGLHWCGLVRLSQQAWCTRRFLGLTILVTLVLAVALGGCIGAGWCTRWFTWCTRWFLWCTRWFPWCRLVHQVVSLVMQAHQVVPLVHAGEPGGSHGDAGAPGGSHGEGWCTRWFPW